MGFNMKRKESGQLDIKPEIRPQGTNLWHWNGKERVMYKGGGKLETFGVNKNRKNKTISNFNADEFRKLNPNLQALTNKQLYHVWKSIFK